MRAPTVHERLSRVEDRLNLVLKLLFYVVVPIYGALVTLSVSWAWAHFFKGS